MHLAKFTFENKELTTQIDEDTGVVWFSANDVCAALGFANPHDAVSHHVDVDDLGKREVIDSLGRAQQANFVNESGLYALILGSTKETAKPFKRWVTSEVLPSIRRDGGYISPHATEEQLEHLRMQVDELMIEVAHLRKIDHDFIARELYSLSKSKGGSFWAQDYAKAAEARDSWKAVARGHEVQHQLVNLALEDVKEVVEHLLSNAKAGSKHRNDLAEVASRISTNLRKRDRILHDYTHGWGTCIPTNVQDFRLY